LKYDWYDPNTAVKGKEIGVPGSGFTVADVKYQTLGLGYLYHITPNVKWVLYYAHVRNEQTKLTGFTKDIKDDVLTCRLQFRF
jgi:phosphate-selective porin